MAVRDVLYTRGGPCIEVFDTTWVEWGGIDVHDVANQLVVERGGGVSWDGCFLVHVAEVALQVWFGFVR